MTNKNYTIERNVQLSADRALRLLDIYRDRRAWLNVAYLLLMFPLGIAYFVFLVTGISLGAGMAVTLVGLPILLGVFLLSRYLVRFDAWIAENMIGAELPKRKIDNATPTETPMLERIGNALRDGNRWKGLGYLLLRFPLGVVTFGFTMALVGLSFGMVTAPFAYASGELEIAFWTVNTFGEAMLASVLGVFVGAGALHILSGVAGLWRVVVTTLAAETPQDGVYLKHKNDDLDDLIQA